MDENTKYPDQNDNQGKVQDECQASDSHQNDYVEEVRFTEQAAGVEMPENNNGQEDTYQSNEYTGHNVQSSDDYNNNNYQDDSYRGNADQSVGYPTEPYQNGAFKSNTYQSNNYQYNTGQNGYYQNDNRQNSVYQNGAYQDNTYRDNAYQNGSFQDNTYMNGAYPNNTYQNYGGNYQQYNGTQPYNGQMELEEPVKVSEWVLALVLMMIPCVNIIMMFVWAFSSTEKKSKSNFFKAYLIFFGISMGVMLLIWFVVVILALTL